MHETNGQVKLPPRGAVRPSTPVAARHSEPEYSHILVPVNLVARDRSAIMLGLQTASAHGASLTLLRVLSPAEKGNSLHWLDAIESLHQPRPRVARNGVSEVIETYEASHADTMRYLDRYVPAGARGDVKLRTECRVGEPASEIARYADEAEVDLVILAAELTSGWLPVVPAPLRRVLQLTRSRVALVIPNAREGMPASNGHSNQ